MTILNITYTPLFKISPVRLFLCIFFLNIFLLSQPIKAEGNEKFFLFYDPEWGFSSSKKAVEKLTPFCDFLGGNLNKKLTLIYLKKENELDYSLNNPDVLFGILNSNVIFNQQKKVNPFLVPVRKSKKTYTKVLITLADSSIKTVSDVKGKDITIVSSDTYTLEEQLSLITSHNFKEPHTFFGSIVKVSTSEAAVLAVIYKLTDCALTTLDSLKAAEKRDFSIQEHIKILYSSPLMINAPFVQIGQAATSEEREILKNSLLSLHETEKGRELLNPLNIDAFVEIYLDDIVRIYSLPDKQQADRQLPENEEEVLYYEVKKGDSLWKIAHKLLGSGYQYHSIAQDNNITNPDLIYEGVKLKIKKRKVMDNN